MTVIVDLTHRPARLLDIVPGRSADVFADWLKNQPDAFRDGIDHVAMDAFAGYKKAATEMVPDATTYHGHGPLPPGRPGRHEAR